MVIDEVPEKVAAPVVVSANAVAVIEEALIVRVLIDTEACSVTAQLVTLSGTASEVAGVQVIVPAVAASSNVTLPEPAPVATEAEAVGAIKTVPAALPLSTPVEMVPPAVIRVKVAAALVVVLAIVMAAVLQRNR